MFRIPQQEVSNLITFACKLLLKIVAFATKVPAVASAMSIKQLFESVLYIVIRFIRQSSRN